MIDQAGLAALEAKWDAAMDAAIAEMERMTAEALAWAKMGGSLHKARQA